MATMTVAKFPTASGAAEVSSILGQAASERLLTIHDAAIVEWEAGKKKPKTRQLHNLTAAGAMSGMFWGMLFGIIFLVPLFGAAVGAAMGALSGSLADVGIDDGFIERIRREVTPGTSALFILTSDGVQDKLAERLQGHPFEIVATNLSAEQEAKLREVFEHSE